MTDHSDLIERLRHADQHSQQRMLGSGIFGEAADALSSHSLSLSEAREREAALEKRRDYYRVRMEIAERDREEADARVRAAQPFFAIRDAIPIGDGLKLVSKDRFDDMTPITITVTKGQYLRAFEAFSAAARPQGGLPEHADATNDPASSDLSSLRKGAEAPCPHAPTYDAGLCCGHPDDCTFVSPSNLSKEENDA